MPTIFDNITVKLSEGLNRTLRSSRRADFCIGYFNLRGWGSLIDSIDNLEGGQLDERFEDDIKYHCRILIGMQRPPQEELQALFNGSDNDLIDNKRADDLKKKMAVEFREQLTLGAPTNKDENTLKRLAQQLKSRHVIVKLHLAFPLHAKLYLAYRDDYNTPKIGYLGSSNLTLAGVSRQGELNVDVTDNLAAEKLENWFQDRWEDKWSIDITKELSDIIDQSWASEKLLAPYHVYMKMAYHLSREARAGISEFNVPRIFQSALLPFQKCAVQIAAHHLNKRHGVMIGDVVGLGKTITASALIKMWGDDLGYRTLIICPRNLIPMWEGYVQKYNLYADVISSTNVQNELPEARRYRLVVVDESHNFRNREGKRYKALREYINEYQSDVVLLTATPYNKSFSDLSSQLRLFIDESYNLGICPERYIESIGGRVQFEARHQVKDNSIMAFEKSDFSDDWVELMRLFLVRRPRSFIKANYAKIDEQNGRYYLEFDDGARSYFSDRIPKKVEYAFDENNDNDQYAKLYAQPVVDIIDRLVLPRYGLGKDFYRNDTIDANPKENQIRENLSRAGTRLIGFARTNLFKRLESSGYAFLLSVSRHILRNYLFIYAIENNLPLPIGKQEAGIIDDFISADTDFDAFDDTKETIRRFAVESEEYMQRAKLYYENLLLQQSKYQWIRSEFFNEHLRYDLIQDSQELLKIIKKCSVWKTADDKHLQTLFDLVTQKHKQEKVLVFTQYSDTADYLYQSLQELGVTQIACATGDCENPTSIAHRFSPKSNDIQTNDEIRVLIATDVLSEGQNLQDAHIVVNYDLPWAIIRLIQRAGRVDRIGQEHHEILCYSFLPEDGIEKIINLRKRLKQRITENAETVGSDEVFFEGDSVFIHDVYNEKSGIFDDEENMEVDLSSYCYQIWKNGTEAHPELLKIIPNLPDVVFSTKKSATKQERNGVVVYTKTPNDNDVLAWVEEDGNIRTQSQIEILKVVKCEPDEHALERLEKHHELVSVGLAHIKESDSKLGGQLGKRTGARYRTYIRLQNWLEINKGTLFDSEQAKRAFADIYNYPLREYAKEVLNRELKSGINDDQLVEIVCSLREENRLSVVSDDINTPTEPRIICSMGLNLIDN